MNASLSSAVTQVCALLRERHGFSAGRAQAHDVMRAAEALGIDDRDRLKTAMRAVCASRPAEVAIFDTVFDDVFSSEEPGMPQPPPKARRFRPDGEEPSSRERQPRYELESDSPADRWEVMRARYSPHASAAQPPAVPGEDYERASALVERLVTRVRLGRSRRYRRATRGPRIDVRRTLRAGLASDELIELRRLARNVRNPRFVLLIDASRSMSEHAAFALQVGHALVRRTRRASTFAFSTELREITLALRAISRSQPHAPEEIGEAWGGGTRIGASLAAFLRSHRARITDDTFVIVVSDGLDVGDVELLRDSMREISRRAARVVWINPHAAEPGFEPTARGMRAVVPFVDDLTVWGNLT